MSKHYFHYEQKHGDIHFASAFTGLTPSCIYKKVQKDQIPYYRIPNSNRILFFAEELVEWIKRK